jgi:cyclopropane-fatty-acyl-phospholipid synthase
MDLARAAAEMFADPSRTFPVRLWDGTLLHPHPGGAPVRGCLVLASRRAVAALLPPASERRIAESFLAGDIELEGDAIALLEAAGLWRGPRLTAPMAPALAAALAASALTFPSRKSLAARLRGALHSIERDGDAIRHHYDASDELYQLFLDRSMVYSCAYFASGAESIEEAQQKKLELVCRKLALRTRERFLDVGCGWGALLEYAVAHHHVDALGVTVSPNQLAAARRRAAHLQTERRVAVLSADYRRLPPKERFHKVASIGMMEHVGRGRLDEYFAAVYRALEPGGLFLNHAIADVAPDTTTLPWARRRGRGFIARYIFPDTDLVPLPLVVAAAERAGFEIRDVESLREHYAETLAAWFQRLDDRFEQAEAIAGRRRARAYRLYLAASAAAFRLGRISVFQVLLAKRDAAGHAVGVPRSRAGWYGPVAATIPSPGDQASAADARRR